MEEIESINKVLKKHNYHLEKEDPFSIEYLKSSGSLIFPLVLIGMGTFRFVSQGGLSIFQVISFVSGIGLLVLYFMEKSKMEAFGVELKKVKLHEDRLELIYLDDLNEDIRLEDIDLIEVVTSNDNQSTLELKLKNSDRQITLMKFDTTEEEVVNTIEKVRGYIVK